MPTDLQSKVQNLELDAAAVLVNPLIPKQVKDAINSAVHLVAELAERVETLEARGNG